MRPSSILRLALLASTSKAISLPNKHTTDSLTLSKRDNCGAGELKVYENNNNFLCVGTTVFWTGVTLLAVYAPIIAAASSQFGTWVVNAFTGAPSATESAKRDGSLEIWDENDVSITYGWKPSFLKIRNLNGTTDTDFSWIHNMTKSYDKTSGNFTQATMTFDGQFEDFADIHGTSTAGTTGKRANTPVTITYYAVDGHQKTSLGYQDIVNLYTQAFFSAPGGVGSECGYAANSGSWHGAFKLTVSGCDDAGTCVRERQF